MIRAGVTFIASGGNRSEGASTITQQLLKNNVFNGGAEKSKLAKIERKLQEQYLAIQLEKQMDKEDIITDYLNTINLGNNTLGVQVAAQRYFGKHVSELTLSECAVIASITQNPSKWNPIRHPEKNQERRDKVLRDMCEQGYISVEERDAAMADNVYDRIQQVNNEVISQDRTYSYFVDELVEQVLEDLQTYRGYTETQAHNMLYSGGLEIYTTQSKAVQSIMDEEVNNPDHYPESVTKYAFTGELIVKHEDGSKDTYTEKDFRKYFRSKNPSYKMVYKTEEAMHDAIEEFFATVTNEGDTTETDINIILQPQLSLTVLENSTGYVRGVTGGRGEKIGNLSLNRATNTLRQPGSTFKVLAAFAPALDVQGATLGTVYYDSPYAVGEKTYRNYWNSKNHEEYVGYSTIRQAIVYSMNIVTTRCLMETVTPELGFQYLKNFGFSTLVENRVTDDGRVLSDITSGLALGGLTDGVSNLEVSAAYSTIANKGVYVKPIFYTKIVDSTGTVIIDNTPETHTVLKENTAYLLTKAMEEVMDKGKYPKTNPDSYGIYNTGSDCDIPNMSIAGKTGTTTADNDFWFTGFSPYYTSTVWTGYDENGTVDKGARYYKKVWQAVMTRIHEGLPDVGFTRPEGDAIEEVQICRKSGKLAVPGVCDLDPRGSTIYTEYFAKGTAPTEVCDRHISVTICTESGIMAGSGCPDWTRQQRTFMLLPPDAPGPTDDNTYTIPAEWWSSPCPLHSGSGYSTPFQYSTDDME